ncbi:Na+/H+ antiporter subunit E [Rothia nasimurium]|uniref:Na+/H+ antiporter subunit E n=1 Tax=Rothia nasimurium TaxID=85336 RepID=UPI001F006D82|nr:Na+/H+ antiporter subunit E [Rothia nasimurium]
MKKTPLTTEKFLHSLPPFLWLVFVWCALWQDFSLRFIAFGAVLAILTMAVFKLPTLYLSNRFNLLYAARFVIELVWNIAKASFEVMWLAATFRPPLRNSIVAVPLRTRSDLLLTAVSHTMSLIPGSVVVEVDRPHSVLYFHVLNTSTDEEIKKFARQVDYFEALIIKAAGSREEYEALRFDEAIEADLAQNSPATRKEKA